MIRLYPSYLYYFLGSSHCSTLLDLIWPFLPTEEIDSSERVKNSIASKESTKRKCAVNALNRMADICPGAIRYWQKGLSNKNIQKDIQNYCQMYLSQSLIKKELSNVKEKIFEYLSSI